MLHFRFPELLRFPCTKPKSIQILKRVNTGLSQKNSQMQDSRVRHCESHQCLLRRKINQPRIPFIMECLCENLLLN